VSWTCKNVGTFGCASPLSFDTGGAECPFVAAIDMSTGACSWARVYDADDAIFFEIPIAVTSSGGITLAAAYRGPAPQGSNLPDSPLPGEAQDRTYLLRLDPSNGDIIQAAAFSPPYVGSFMGDVRPTPRIKSMIAVDDTVYAAGSFYGTMAMPDHPIYPLSFTRDSGDGEDAFVLELDPKVLGVKWVEPIRSVGYSNATSLAVHGADLIVAGTMDGPAYSDQVTNEPDLCTENSSICPYLLRMGREDRKRHWFREWVAPQPNTFWRGNLNVAVGPDGVALATHIYGPIDFGSGLLEPTSDSDIAVAKLPPLP